MGYLVGCFHAVDRGTHHVALRRQRSGSPSHSCSLASGDRANIQKQRATPKNRWKGRQNHATTKNVGHQCEIWQCRQQKAGVEVFGIWTERRSRAVGYGRTRFGKQYNRSCPSRHADQRNRSMRRNCRLRKKSSRRDSTKHLSKGIRF